jgi:hypothetical protein
MASSKLHIRQEASMKRWVGMCVASLAGIAAPAAASTVNLQYAESVGFTLEYFGPPSPHVRIEEEWREDTSKYRADVYPDEGGYSLKAVIYFQFISQEPLGFGSVSELAGRTINFATLRDERPDFGFGYPLYHVYWNRGGYFGNWGEETYYCGHHGHDYYDCVDLDGSISFDSRGSVYNYGIHFSRSMDAVLTVFTSSSGSIMSRIWEPLWNPEAVEGLKAFDFEYFEEGASDHFTRPGYWQVSVHKDCWLTDGDGSHVDDVECRSAAPTPIPLPASWGFLLIAVGSLAGMRAVRNARSA